MFRGLELTPDLLAAQGRTLRALARSLLRDDDAAQDVVQETWLACLARPAAMPDRVASWLGTVASRLALRRKRGESRRRERERLAAAPERLDALQERALEREEALRAVTGALLALEEPYKSALIARYYDERSPAEIAAELGLPLATVKSRLARGLERLRARLGAELGDERRARALLALAGAPLAPGVGTGAGAAPAAALAATPLALLKLSGAAAATLVAAGAFAAWRGAGEPARATSGEPTQTAGLGAFAALGGAQASQQPAAGGGAGRAADEPAREPLAPAGDARPAPDAFPSEESHVYKISGVVRDDVDLPLAGARVLLAPRGLRWNEIAVTDERGAFSVEIVGRKATLACALTVEQGDASLGVCELELAAGRELTVDVALVASGGKRALASRKAAGAGGGFGLPGAPATAEKRQLVERELAERGRIEERAGERIVDDRGEEGGAGIAGERKKLVEGEATERKLAGTLEPARALKVTAELGLHPGSPRGTLGAAPRLARDADGRGRFVDAPPDVACARDAGPHVVEEPRGLETRRMLREKEVARGAMVGRMVEGQRLQSSTVRGTVRDASGLPLAHVDVGWGGPGTALARRAFTDENGAFELEIEPGERELHAGGGDRGRAASRVTVEAGKELAWDAVLERGDEVAGLVRLAGGEPAPNARVELWSVGPTRIWCDSTRADAHGRFAIPNVPAGPLELVVYAGAAEAGPSAFPLRRVEGVFAGSDVGEIVLAPEELATHALVARVLDPDGSPHVAGELRVWHEASGRGLVTLQRRDGTLALGGLPAGTYRVEALGALGWRDLGRVWIHDEDVELEPVRFAAPSALSWSTLPRADGPAPSVSLWRAHAGVLARVAGGAELDARLLPLAPGDYVACAETAKGRVELPLTLAAGSPSGLTLSVGADGAPKLDPGAPAALLGGVDLGSEVRAARCNGCHGG